jgi:hypothetical protein
MKGANLAIFLTLAAAVPVGVSFTATLFFPSNSYTYVGHGTTKVRPDPSRAPALLIALMGRRYWLVWRRRKSH